MLLETLQQLPQLTKFSRPYTRSSKQCLTTYFNALWLRFPTAPIGAVLRHELTTAQSARLFALLNLSFADAVIAFYDAKYTYNFWRPVTAIREAAIAGNPEAIPDPDWLPEVGNTTPDPSYPGAHAVISAAGASILTSFFGKERFDFTVTSEVLPGVDRSFESFPAAAEEATLSRIFEGVHFRSDLTTGQTLGRQIADFVVDNFLTPVHERGEDR